MNEVAISRHGTVEVRHYPHDDTVAVQAGRHLLAISDAEARDLTFALAALFPSMVREEAVDVARTHAAVERVQALADQLTADAKTDPGSVLTRASMARKLNRAIKGEQS